MNTDRQQLAEQISDWAGDGAQMIVRRDRVETALGVILLFCCLGLFGLLSAAAMNGPSWHLAAGAALCLIVMAVCGVAARRPNLASTLTMRQAHAVSAAASRHPEIRARLEGLKSAKSPIRLQQFLEIGRISDALASAAHDRCSGPAESQ